MRTRYYTLLELMVVASISLLLMGSIATLFYRGMLAQRADMRNTLSHQRIELVRMAWQEWARDATGSQLATDAMVATDRSVTWDRANDLLLVETGRKRSLSLPQGAIVTFALEGDGRLALMNIAWQEESLQMPRQHRVRLVAALPVAGGHTP